MPCASASPVFISGGRCMSEPLTTDGASAGNRSHVMRTGVLVWLACIGLAVLWDRLFWGWPIGVSVAIFAGVIGLMLVARAPDLVKTGQGRFIVAAAFVTVLALVEEPSSLAILMMAVAVGTM